jgi:hypothetical protein
MKFEKKDGIYYIDNTPVETSVYISMLEEQLSKNAKTPKLDEQKIHELEYNCEDECTCPECQKLLDFIFDLSDMEDHEALETFRDYVNSENQKAFIKGMISAYDEVSKFTNKTSARWDNALDNIESGCVCED